MAAELLGALTALAGGELPPSLEPQWRVLLRNEFHDILPGSRSARWPRRPRPSSPGDRRGGGRHRREVAELADGRPRREEPLLIVNPDLSPRPLRVELPWAGGCALSSRS